MRLHSFQIRNFKSIIDTGNCKISDIDNIVILAWQNESGKSAVLEALDFFANWPADKFVELQKRTRTNDTEVKCSFLIGKNDFEYLDQEFKDNEEIKKYIRTKKEVTLMRKYKDNKDEWISVDQEFFDKLPEKGEEDNVAISDESTPPVVVVKDKATLIFEISKIIIDIVPIFSLYNSFEDLLPSEKLVSELQNSKAIKNFERVFATNLLEIANITDPRESQIAIRELENRATDDFNDSWSQSIKSQIWDKKYKFTIRVNHAEPKKIEFMIEGEDWIPQFLEQRSLWFRWFSAFHLRLRALMKETEDYEYEENDNNIVILIDEPGQNLHDVAQKDVKRILEQTAKKHIQIIYSTHNPNLIGDIDSNGIEFTRIRIVANHTVQWTKVFTVAQFMSNKDWGSIDALSPIRSAMGLSSMDSIFDKEKLNVIVEGITDNYYLSALRDFMWKDNKLHFIPVCGVDNVKSMVGLLIGWGMNYKAVFDDDPKQWRKAYNTLKEHFFERSDDIAHQHIYKIKECNGIEDIFSKADFQKYIYTENLSTEEKKKNNSDIAKDVGKEIIARQFSEKLKNNPTDIKLDGTSKKKIEEIFDWLYQSFSIVKSK